MVLGAKHVESPFIEFGPIATLVYFSYFLVLVPATNLIENSLTDLYLLKNMNNKVLVFLKSIYAYYVKLPN